jgi:hypothetical protein
VDVTDDDLGVTGAAPDCAVNQYAENTYPGFFTEIVALFSFIGHRLDTVN